MSIDDHTSSFVLLVSPGATFVASDRSVRSDATLVTSCNRYITCVARPMETSTHGGQVLPFFEHRRLRRTRDRSVGRASPGHGRLPSADGGGRWRPDGVRTPRVAASGKTQGVLETVWRLVFGVLDLEILERFGSCLFDRLWMTWVEDGLFFSEVRPLRRSLGGADATLGCFG